MADICVFQNSVPCVGGYALRPPRYYPPIQPWTIRVRMATPGDVPQPEPYYAISYGGSATVTRLFDDMDIYDVTYEVSDWSHLLGRRSDSQSGFIAEVLGANTSGVVNMWALFESQTALSSVSLFDTSSVENMSSMFDSCTSLQSVPLFDTSSVETMGLMFHYCTSLQSVPLFDTSHVVNISGMLHDCTSLTACPTFDLSNVTDADFFMDGCSALTEIPAFATTSMVSVMYAFHGCTHVQSGAYALYRQMSSQATPPSKHTGTFRDCGSETRTGQSELARIPSNWK